MWVRIWILGRPLYGTFDRLMMELEAEDVAGFKNFIRLDPQHFQELLHRLDRGLHDMNVVIGCGSLEQQKSFTRVFMVHR